MRHPRIAEESAQRGWSRTSLWLTALIAVAFAALMALLEFHFHFISHRTETDDGVYFGEGVMLSHGFVPYRSYVDVQPPGIAILMAPFGFIGRLAGDRVAFELARLFVVAVGVANIGLLGRLVRLRSWIGVFTALTVLAFYLDTIIASHTILLEPFLVFGTLLGLLIVFGDTESATFQSSRWLMAGIVLGLTTSVKIWEVLPVIVLLVFASLRGRRCLASYVAGVVGGVVLVCGPFALMAPGNFFHEVIVVQATRSHLHQVAERSRLLNLLGSSEYGHLPLRAIIWAPVILCVVVAAVYLLIHFARRGYADGGLTNLDTCAIACVVVVAISFFATAEYDPHYGGFIAPFVALALSTIVIRLTPTAHPSIKVVIAIAMLAYFAASDRSFIESKSSNFPVPVATIDRTFSPSTCIISQTYAPLILADRYNIFATGCPHVLDLYGTELVDGSGVANLKADADALALQTVLLRGVRGAQGVILLVPASKDANFGPVVRRYFKLHYSLSTHADGLYIYAKRTSPD
jgi:hypothetical protein